MLSSTFTDSQPGTVGRGVQTQVPLRLQDPETVSFLFVSYNTWAEAKLLIHIWGMQVGTELNPANSDFQSNDALNRSLAPAKMQPVCICGLGERNLGRR